ncbi:MAG TPA: nuclear transport factor 2 family protein [Candidatus Polarisedimenticolia bacterium]|nr:nuclear transport factor 2 family protein [Candidatus Polarisedimenticolia bacterium]
MPTATEEEISAVRLSNETFYRALTSLDIQAMDSVWLHEEGARCIHPGWEVIEGWEVIRQSWDIIFSNTTSLKVEASQVTVRLEGEMAWVSCLESITSGRDSDGITLARATNLFIKTAGGWKMILHHASQIPSGADSDESEDDAEAIIH